MALGCLGACLLLALLSAPAALERDRRPVPFAAVRSSALLAAGGFAGADIAGRVLTGDRMAPSLLVLLIGLGVHLLVGAASIALWHCWAGAVPWRLWPPREVRPTGAPRRSAMAAAGRDRPRPRQWTRVVAGRAPPRPAV